MQIYKDKFKVVWENKKLNKEDNYIPFKQGQIYRYDSNILIIWLRVKSGKLTVPHRIVQLIKDAGINILEEFEDDESAELRINESDLDQVADVLKIKKRKKLDKESERYKKLADMLQKARMKG